MVCMATGHMFREMACRVRETTVPDTQLGVVEGWTWLDHAAWLGVVDEGHDGQLEDHCDGGGGSGGRGPAGCCHAGRENNTQWRSWPS